MPNMDTLVVQQQNDTKDWELTSGATRYGPSIDHTRGTRLGKELFNTSLSLFMETAKLSGNNNLLHKY